MEEKDLSNVISFIRNKWSDNVICPMCRTRSFNVSNEIFELRKYNNGGLVVGGTPIVPIIPVTCMNCGNTILVNAMVAGAITTNNKNGQNGEEAEAK